MAGLRATTAAVVASVLALGLGAIPAGADETDPSEQEQAAATAADTQESVVVPGSTDETSQVFANPDGTFTLETHAAPVRVRGENGWEPVDTTLVEAEDGTVRPRAAAAEIAFSDGGETGAMASVSLGSKTVSLDWPTALPEPVLDGDQATYPDVLPDVDLVLTASADGFTQVLVVHTREAATHPDLAELQLALDTQGVEMSQDSGGNLTATGTEGGEPVFVAPAPSMWDSGGDGLTATAKAQRPAAGARTAQLDTHLDGDTLRLVPDPAMLTDETTRFPVYIDPSVAVSRPAWAYVDKSYPSTSYYNSSDDDTGIGYEPQYGHTKRGFWRFSVYERTRDAEIHSATFRGEITHAFGCTDADLDLYRTTGISSGTTWNNQPSQQDHLDTVTVDYGRPGCVGSGVEFDATDAYEWGRTNGKSSITLGLYGNETVSGSNYDWRRIDKNPTLQVVYNNDPAKPDTAKISDSHGGVCSTDPANPRLINVTDPTLRAFVRDEDSQYTSQKLKARFVWWIDAQGERDGQADSTYQDVATWPDGSYHSATVTGLPENELIGYRAIVDDQDTWGPWSDWCYLKVDTTNPETGPAVSSSDYPEGDTPTGSVGKPGEFTFTANGVSDAAAYHYSVNDATCSTELTPDQPGGAVTTSITPTHDGPNLIHARTTDASGNSSACVLVHTFTVAQPSDPVAHFPFDEGTGTTAADTQDGSRTAQLSQDATWGRGRVGTEDSGAYRTVGTALHTDGYVAADPSPWDHAATSGPVVDTTESFSVAAWVRLDGKSAHHTAVAQNGTEQSAFHLGYQNNDDAWVFKLAPADEHWDSEPWTYARSDNPPETGVWTHLLGTYNATTNEATLYVDGVKQETSTRPQAEWNATGPLTMGRGTFQGDANYYWPGDVDDVKVWDRVVVGEQPPEPEARPQTWHLANEPVSLTGRWQLDETSGTTAADDSDYGRDATLDGDPATAWGQALNDVTFSPGVTLDGVDEHLATAGPVLRTDRSFSVAAWVRLSEIGANSTAVSQDGDVHSAFYLSYQHTYDYDNWVMKLPPSDTMGASGWHRALSDQAPTFGVWTHLAASYDHTAGEITLYVDGVKQGTATQDTPWHAGGPLLIGGAQFEEAFSDPWNGDIDDVHVYQGVLSEDEVTDIRGGQVVMP
ncbi:LamG-like jellyroll fold domain-containing protein [Salinactinospora qingdaonensis]|uniref:LamG-like jellyroll fold domain-containing protein n=1 Tax=Salinactinospora qingdaonensis TaxID=702744 RepID=A0ABP7FDX3_9ACTN